MTDALAAPGELRRFILEGHPVRGFSVQMGAAWQELRCWRHYSPEVEALLGEAVSASVLLAATLKFCGSLSLQLRGNGAVSLLIAQCTDDFRVRALARTAALTPDPTTPAFPAVDRMPSARDFHTLVGDGQLTVTLEAQDRATRYQGIVALGGDSLSGCLEEYFATSEQLPTRLRLTADATGAGGVLVQKLPATDDEAAGARSLQVWEDLERGLSRIEPQRLLHETATQWLPLLCGPHDCRLFGATALRFQCRCNAPRVAQMLRALGAVQLQAALAQEGAVTITCEFCGRPYRYDASDVEQLLASVEGDRPPSVN